MQAETLRLNTEERKEVNGQTRLQVMASGSGDDMQVSEVFSCKTVILEGNDEASHQHQDVSEVCSRKKVILGGNDEASHQHQEVVTPLLSNTVTTEGENGIIHQVEKEKNLLPAPDPIYFNPSNSSLYAPSGPIGITISATEGVQEIHLTKMFVMPANHEFYCPKCDVSIDKVFFCQRRETGARPSIEPPPSDFDFPVQCSACFSYLIQKGKHFFTGLVSCIPGRGELSIPIPGPVPTPPPVNSKGLEILKSIVYGGLAELLASLSVVTSAASADATTLNIVALAVANLIGGFFVLLHNLRDLNASQPREQGRTETNEAEDKYYELLGKKENYLLHAFFAILSFLIFGLVPPIVYGFTFRKSGDKDLKLAAVAGASLIGITLLGIAKAYTQRPNHNYVTTVFFYVSSGVLASLLTYLAGDAVKRLVEQLGWFDEPRSNFGSSLPEMSIEKTRWGAY